MGLVRFNADSSSSTGSSLLYRMKPSPAIYQLYGQGHAVGDIPVVRSGASDKAFWATANTGINLSTTNSSGVATTTAAITYNTYLASSNAIAFHMNSADTSLYVLLTSGTQLQLIKIHDSTGAVTAIGSAFTPTTIANWGGTMEVDSVSGYLKITFNGKYHELNKTTGAIVTQNTAVSLGSYLAKSVVYKTADGTVGLTNLSTSTATDGVRAIPATVHASYGYVQPYQLSNAEVGGVLSGVSAAYVLKADAEVHLIDNDKVLIGSLTASNTLGSKIYLRTDFDKLVKSMAEVGAGVV